MNKLELAQEIGEKVNSFQKTYKIGDYYTYPQFGGGFEGVVFSVWKNYPELDDFTGANVYFHPDLTRVYPDDEYAGNEDEARAALKEFLESEV
jgi:hypothetical protein